MLQQAEARADIRTPQGQHVATVVAGNPARLLRTLGEGEAA